MTRIRNFIFSPIGSCLGACRWHLRVRAFLWRDLRRDASHPVASHLRRQLSRARHLPPLRLSLVVGFLLLVFLAYVYVALAHMIVWLLPVWLMLFSASYCAIWIARIVSLLSRQSILGVLDEISVIPPGPIFIYLTICKVVLNRDDAVVWLSILRRLIAGLVLLVLLLTLCIALSLLAESSLLELAAILLDLVLTAAVIWLEHSQSAVIACLIAVEVSKRVTANVDKTSIALVAFLLAQISGYALALAIIIALDRIHLSLALLLFLLIRELLAASLWRLILHGANEDMGRLAASRWTSTPKARRGYGPHDR